ncbi:hypothetical protein [Aminobacter sp. AP02]|uniref:hypothetical protein n=1 Tax=Aminobacter sp. AP02 TaxID=2135737 RepID=UPI000D6AB482|nr:hypothetical protein [Aminobacter sp. AP02]PWK63881.1 hypothetical protein C8K44_12248 [Aminobacter sp. AP02]
MLIEIRDDVIWAKHLRANPALYNTVLNLAPEETINLSVDGIFGKWAKMRTGADGRSTLGLKPVGAMATVWQRLQERRGEKVHVHWPDNEDDAWLRLADMTFEEWYSAEDEEAFGDLQPL